MEFRLLGAVECRVDGEPVPLGRPQSRCLLAVLLLERGRVVPLARLVGLLWEEPPPRARAVVQTHVSRLRAVLRAAGADRYGVRLVTRGTGYAIEVLPGTVDLDQFRQLVDQGRAEPDPAGRAAYLRKALALWWGPALADVATGPVRGQLCASLDELLVGVHEECAEVELGLGRHRELVPELAELVARYPLRERLVELLMLAQYRAGQQAAALAAYRQARQRLVEELGIEPGAGLRALEQAVLAQDPALQATRTGPAAPAAVGGWRGPRSSLTSLVGRAAELSELAALLAGHRLVTVVGVGGVGKTALALHVAEAVRTGSDRTVVVLPLAPAGNGDEAVLALGAALEVHGGSVAELLVRAGLAMAARPCLLVLDNCEHLTAALAALVRQLRAAAPELVVLATSREPLGLPEELVWRLKPLAVPAPDALAAADTPAVSLFLRRAAEADPGFVADGENLAAVARIARRVDGLPLALELAAGRLRTLPAPELADELEHSFGLLATDRHRADHRHTAMTAMLDWSYRLLPAPQQRLLPRLSVFRGGFTAAAAAAVCGADQLPPERVEPALAGLVDRSLVQLADRQPAPATGGGTRPARYRLLEVVREDALGRLTGGEVRSVADRHLDHWLGQARAIAGRAIVSDQVTGWLALKPELDNLRAAVDHAYRTGRVADAVELTCLLSDSWLVEGSQFAEIERWLARTEPHLASCPTGLRGLVRFNRGLLRKGQDDCREAHRLLGAAIADLVGVEPPRTVARIAAVRCAGRLLRPECLPQARELFAAVSGLADPYPVTHGVTMLAEALIGWGGYREAADLCRRYAARAASAEPAAATLYLAMRCSAELGAGEHPAAGSTAGELRQALELPGNYLLRTVPAGALALHALVTRPAGQARVQIGGLLRDLEHRRTPVAAPGYAVRLLLAEADRRAGYPEAAVATLRRGLAVALSRSDYASSLPGVVGAALLATDLGDHAAAAALAGGWERVRQRLGLPAPLGYADQVAAVLGLSPHPPAAPGPATGWDEPALRELLQRAYDWSVATTGAG